MQRKSASSLSQLKIQTAKSPSVNQNLDVIQNSTAANPAASYTWMDTILMEARREAQRAVDLDNQQKYKECLACYRRVIDSLSNALHKIWWEWLTWYWQPASVS